MSSKMEFNVRFPGEICVKCAQEMTVGQRGTWIRQSDRKGYYHVDCAELPTKDDLLKLQTGTDANGKPVYTRVRDLQNGAVVQTAVTPAHTTPVTLPTPEPATPAVTTPAVIPPANGNGADIFGAMAGAMAPYLRDLLEAKVSAADVEALIQSKVIEALESHTRTVIVERRNPDGTKSVQKLGLTHKLFEKLTKLINLRVNVYLYGAAGGGKTTAARQAAEANDLPFYYIALNIQSQPSLLFGFINAAGEYVETDFFKWYKSGGVFLFDEIDNTNGNLLTSLNGALENGRAAFPCGIVERHPDAIAIAAGNTVGTGANATYSSRQVMDGATRERFEFVKWEYDESLEMAAAKQNHPDAGIWVNWVRGVRATCDKLNLKLIASPRASIRGALLLNEFKPGEVADMVLFKGCDSDTVNKILANNPLPAIA